VTPHSEARRVSFGHASRMETDRTFGRTLFPSPGFSHWPPYEALAEVTAVGRSGPEPHAHAREEVLNYVLSGRLNLLDDQQRTSEVPMGSASLFTTVRERTHDLYPRREEQSHWLALVLRLPAHTPDPPEPHQMAAGTRVPGGREGVVATRIVGPEGPLRSVLGLEAFDLQFRDPVPFDLRVEAGRSALLFIVEGRARLGGRILESGDGVLQEDPQSLALELESPGRVFFATVARGE
jgi:redox-sensitive bicupin YhaK (pirin superfamily)